MNENLKTFEDELNAGFDEELESISERTASAHAAYLRWLKLLESGLMPAIPEALGYNWGSSMWPVSITVPLDKVLLHRISMGFVAAGWKVSEWRILSNNVSFTAERPDNYHMCINIQAYSYGSGTTCKVVKIAERSNTIVKTDGVYEIICEEGAEEALSDDESA